MKKTIWIVLGSLGVLVVAGGMLAAGLWMGRRTAGQVAFGQPYGQPYGFSGPAGGFGGMMGGRGRMNGYGQGMMGGRGMMNGSGFGYGTRSGAAAPLTIDQAYQAAHGYLATLKNSDLKIAEVMVFDNNAYVRVIEKSSGIGAFELLVDPLTQTVYPEHGANMMWNLKYGGLNHGRMMGGLWNSDPANVSSSMTLSAGQALQAAQKYLDSALPGARTAADADPFYGYYTIDIQRDGATIGMLSVNGFSGQVLLHTWHGTYISSQDY